MSRQKTDGPCGSCRGSSEPGFNVDTLKKLTMHKADGIAYTVTQQQNQHQQLSMHTLQSRSSQVK